MDQRTFVTGLFSLSGAYFEMRKHTHLKISESRQLLLVLGLSRTDLLADTPIQNQARNSKTGH